MGLVKREQTASQNDDFWAFFDGGRRYDFEPPSMLRARNLMSLIGGSTTVSYYSVHDDDAFPLLRLPDQPAHFISSSRH
jgi:hypothetical protein